MLVKDYEKLPLVSNRCSIVFEGRRLNVKVKGQGHTGSKLCIFGPILVFPDENSNVSGATAMTFYGNLPLVSNRCCIVFEGPRSKVKVTRDQNLSDFGIILSSFSFLPL